MCCIGICALIPQNFMSVHQRSPPSSVLPSTPTTIMSHRHPNDLLKRIILWRYLLNKIPSNDRQLLHNIHPHLGHIRKKEKTKDSEHGAKRPRRSRAAKICTSAIAHHSTRLWRLRPRVLCRNRRMEGRELNKMEPGNEGARGNVWITYNFAARGKVTPWKFGRIL